MYSLLMESLSDMRMNRPSASSRCPILLTNSTLSSPVLPFRLMLRAVCGLPFVSSTTTGMVLLALITCSTRFRSVFSSAWFSVRIASAHISILWRSSVSRSRVSTCDTTSEAVTMMVAAITSMIFTCLILSVHCMFS